MANWEAIKEEYVTSAIGYRQLAKKHGVSLQALAQRGHREGWVALRQNNPISEPDQQFRLQRLQTVTDRLLCKVEAIVEGLQPGSGACTSLRHISGTLKDIKDIQMLRSEADIREQEAKIASLYKRGEQPQPQNISVVLEGGVEEYAR